MLKLISNNEIRTKYLPHTMYLIHQKSKLLKSGKIVINQAIGTLFPILLFTLNSYSIIEIVYLG